jgi:hypothetical protein
MSASTPADRPTASEALAQWTELRGKLGGFRRSRRLKPKDEEDIAGACLNVYDLTRATMLAIVRTAHLS